MKTIAVVANGHKTTTPATLARLQKKAAALGARLVSYDESDKLCQGIQRVSVSEEADLLVTLGGDGTVLRAVRLLAGKNIPILGVNLGGLGFMTGVPIEELEKALDIVASGKHTLSMRTLLACKVIRNEAVIAEYHALNDIALGWGKSPRVVTLSVRIDGEEVTSYICDGLLLSTPTGSTAHSLSAGGPILHPGTCAFVLNPICPHTLSNRPLVIADGSELSITVTTSPKELLLAADGQSHQSVAEGDILEIAKSEQVAQFVQLPGYSYFALLRQKLHWRGSSL